MPRIKTTYPEPTREKGQRSLDLPLYLDRLVPAFSQPEWLEADKWRSFVARQPFATIFRDTLISNVLALDWKIEPKDNDKRDEYKEDIDYYTDFFTNTGDYDYAEIVEWIGKDLLDLPFGGAAELGREGDAPDGKVLWIEPLDGGTLFPTYSSVTPVGQAIKEMAIKTVYFPAHAIDRIYMSPRTEIRRKGWGMPPPEKIYLAIEMLGRGDIYYAKLLLDTPEAGILDLIDMSKESATNWVEAWKTMLTGIDPFKIPVLYEHEKAATWIPFSRPPADIMFDKAIMKYVGIVGAGYGMSPSDIGFSPVSSGGETLAGSIRGERKTKRTGLAVAKRKFTTFYNKMLPNYLGFKFIDLDDELSTNIGRARLASMTAFGSAIDKQVLTADESRQQLVSDGLINISIPEKFPEEERKRLDEKKKAQTPFGNPFGAKPGTTPERPGMLGKPVTPSQGGYGEKKSDIYAEFSDVMDASILSDEPAPINEFSEADMELARAFVLVAQALLGGRRQTPIQVFVPKSEQVAPNVVVKVPEQKAPVVNVSVPEQKSEPPIVQITTPPQKAPIVNIRAQRKSTSRQKVKRDQDGNLVETVTETEFKYDGE